MQKIKMKRISRKWTRTNDNDLQGSTRPKKMET
jgi:hypothetical protein